MGAESKFPQILTLDTYGLMDLSWQLFDHYKGMKIVSGSYVIGHKFIKFICHETEQGVTK